MHATTSCTCLFLIIPYDIVRYLWYDNTLPYLLYLLGWDWRRNKTKRMMHGHTKSFGKNNYQTWHKWHDVTIQQQHSSLQHHWTLALASDRLPIRYIIIQLNTFNQKETNPNPMIHKVFLACLAVAFISQQLHLPVPVVSAKKLDRENTPHGHNGKMKAYTAGPFGMQIQPSDEDALLKGNPVMKQLPPDDPNDKLGGKAICVQDVEAPKNAVWNQILDMDAYVGKVNKVKECNNYVVKDKGDGTMQVKTKMVLGVMPGYSVRCVRCSIILWCIIYDEWHDWVCFVWLDDWMFHISCSCHVPVGVRSFHMIACFVYISICLDWILSKLCIVQLRTTNHTPWNYEHHLLLLTTTQYNTTTIFTPIFHK